MALKLENNSSIKLPKGTPELIEKITKSIPVEHLRGLDKIKLVDFINDPRLKNVQMPKGQMLPGLYHPRQGGQNAFLEVSLGALLRPFDSYFARLMPRLGFKANLAAILFTLIGQHYFLTLRHSVKRSDIESKVRQYADKHLKDWSEKQTENSYRAKFFKPFRPMLERWAKSLNKKAANASKKAAK